MDGARGDSEIEHVCRDSDFDSGGGRSNVPKLWATRFIYTSVCPNYLHTYVCIMDRACCTFHYYHSNSLLRTRGCVCVCECVYVCVSSAHVCNCLAVWVF